MAFFNWFAKKSSQETKIITDEDMVRIVGEFKKSLPSIQEKPEVLDEITFDQVVSYLKSDRPENVNFTQAAIIRQEHPEGTFLALVFLDENNALIYLPNGILSGRQIVAKKLNKKLSKFLGDRDFNLLDLKQISIIKAIKIASIIFWTLVILLVLIPLLGSLIMTQALAAELNPSPSLAITPNMVAFGGPGKQQAFEQAHQTAYKEAQQYAEQELDQWEKELIERIDTDFLDWYFSYFNQKTQEGKALFYYLGEMAITGFNQSVVEDRLKDRIINNINREFARRVVSSKSAENKIKTIVIDTTDLYLQYLSETVQNVPKTYKISQVEWQQYLDTITEVRRLGLDIITVRLENEQGNESLSVEIIGIGSYLTIKAGSLIASKAGSKFVSSIVSRSLASIIDPAVGLGLIALDYWDYTNEVAEARPRLRKDLVEFLHQIKNNLLKDPNFGVMSAVKELDEKIKNSI